MSVRLSLPDAWKATEASHTGIFTTLRHDGQPVALPVWFVVADSCIFISSPSLAAKVTRVRRDPRCSFLIESGLRWSELLAVQWTGRADLVAESDPITTPVRDAINRKYAAFQTPAPQMPAESREFYAKRGELTLLRITVDDRFLSWNNAVLDSGHA